MQSQTSSAEDNRFGSWKEIAAYLGRDIRTVRRWEKRGLPVRRVPGGARGAVYAYRAEIDAWLSKGQEKQHGTAQPVLEGVSAIRAPEPVPESEAKSVSEIPSAALRLKLTTAVAVILPLAILLAVYLAWIRKSGGTSSAEGPPEIMSVSPILPKQVQIIVIEGQGFGLHTPYTNTDIPFVAVRDKTRDWSAGRIIPQNWDKVTLDVESWGDKRIVISGFSGEYGLGDWKLASGDEIEVAVWNPQSGRGAATYRLRVSASPTQ